MRKYLSWGILITVMVVSLVFCLTSCGGDDNDDSVAPVNQEEPNTGNSGSSDEGTMSFDASLLIGTWKTTFTGNDYEMFDFNTNMTFKHYGFAGGAVFEETGTWALDTNTKILSLTDEYKTESTEILGLTSTELKMFNCIYLRVSDNGGNNQGGENADESSQGNGQRGEVAESFKGSGTKSDPYIISKASELRKMSDDSANGETYSGKYFKMAADVKINPKVLMSDGELISDSTKLEKWIPIQKFAGYFDGQGHSVSGIYINADTDNCGLFGMATGATIENLVIEDTYIKAKAVTGSVVGRMFNESFISQCVCKNSHIISGGYIGGIVGIVIASSVLNCANYGKVEANGHGCGGIVGYYQGKSIVNCVNKGVVVGCSNNSSWSGGGVVGGNLSDRTPQVIQDCVNIGRILYGGAIIGRLKGVLTIKDNYYLDESAEKWIGSYEFNPYYSSTKTNITAKSAEEMKSQDFLDMLNNTAKKHATYSLWKFGKDGYPTLDFVNE